MVRWLEGEFHLHCPPTSPPICIHNKINELLYTSLQPSIDHDLSDLVNQITIYASPIQFPIYIHPSEHTKLWWSIARSLARLSHFSKRIKKRYEKPYIFISFLISREPHAHYLFMWIWGEPFARRGSSSPFTRHLGLSQPEVGRTAQNTDAGRLDSNTFYFNPVRG